MATATAAYSFNQVAITPSLHKHLPLHHTKKATAPFIRGNQKWRKRVHDKSTVIRGGRSLSDFIGGDLIKLDIGQWLSDVEEHKALAIYSPHEGGYEGRYLNRLVHRGYHFLDLTARGLGDPETTLTKFHPICPVLSKAELQFLAILPSLRPRVRVIAECGNWRKFMWTPLKDVAGLPATGMQA